MFTTILRITRITQYEITKPERFLDFFTAIKRICLFLQAEMTRFLIPFHALPEA